MTSIRMTSAVSPFLARRSLIVDVFRRFFFLCPEQRTAISAPKPNSFRDFQFHRRAVLGIAVYVYGGGSQAAPAPLLGPLLDSVVIESLPDALYSCCLAFDVPEHERRASDSNVIFVSSDSAGKNTGPVKDLSVDNDPDAPSSANSGDDASDRIAGSGNAAYQPAVGGDETKNARIDGPFNEATVEAMGRSEIQSAVRSVADSLREVLTMLTDTIEAQLERPDSCRLLTLP